MSTIFGLCYKDSKPVREDELGLMSATLNHWVADNKGMWRDGSAGLGHLMLWNTPESLQEKLPYYDEVARLSITSDARIDNRDELFALLGLATPTHKQLPDSQLILLAYKKFGTDCVRQLVGDFAFAIWDAQEQRLFCARDQMGVRPFFYYCRDNVFAFASEKKGLLCLPMVDQTINKQYFYNLSFMSPIQAADTTLYRHIHRLEPAHSLSFSPWDGHVRLTNYWILDAETELKLNRKEDYYEGLRHHFENAVKCRLRSDYPIGAELSGGIDSSSITGVATHFLKGTGTGLITFTNADSPASKPFSDKRGGSETGFAEEVIRFNSIKDPVFISEDVSDDPLDIVELLSKINDGLERWTPHWQLPIRQAAGERGIRTMFSGFPGDEMVTYRGNYSFLDKRDHGNYRAYFEKTINSRFNKLKPFLGQGVEYLLHKAANVARINAEDIKRVTKFFPFPLQYRLNRCDEAWQDVSFKQRFDSYRHYQRYRLLKPHIVQRMEMETQYGRYYRMEASFPMADIRLTQFYLSMPNSIKYEGPLTRMAWRKAMAGYLPETLLQRDQKVGIMIPYALAPAMMENERTALTKLLDGGIGRKSRITVCIAEQKHIMKYLILISWYKKNFENL